MTCGYSISDDSDQLELIHPLTLYIHLVPHMTPTTLEGPTRRRTTRACDQCRKTKSRCEHPHQSVEPCRNCVLSGTECTFLEPSHKRGPPKGYLTAIEQRLHDAEALLGVIVSSSDPRATTMVQDLSKDSLAAAIISRVTNGTFGPIGRNALQNHDSNTNTRRRSTDLRNQQTTEQETPVIDGNGHLVFTTPSHTWQDYLNLRLSLESRIRNQDQLKPFSQDSLVAPRLSHIPGTKLPSLDTPFHFQVCSTTIDSSHMNMDTCVVMSSSPNNEKLIASGELQQNMLPQPQSAETTLVDIPSDMECNKNVYNRDFLTRSLGLETNFSSMVGSSLTTGQPVSESPLELNKTRIRWTKADEVDTASWTRLVVEGAESTLFENVSAAESDVQMHTELTTQNTCVSTQG